MSLRIRFQYPTGSSLGYSIERLSDATYYDFSTSNFVDTTPVTLITPLPESAGSFQGRYFATLTPTPNTVFTDGDYVVTVHNTAASNVVVAELAATMINGNDTSYYVDSSTNYTIRNQTSSAIDLEIAGGTTVRIFGGGDSITLSSALLDMTGQIATLLAAGSITTTPVLGS
jgi:hypothetical protein